MTTMPSRSCRMPIGCECHDSPHVNRLIHGEQHQVQILQHSLLLDGAPVVENALAAFDLRGLATVLDTCMS